MAENTIRVLEVRLYGRIVGTITREAGNKGTVFAYSEEYAQERRAIALSAKLPVRKEPYQWPEIGRWLDGLLPEGERRERIAREIGAIRMSTYSMIEKIGNECAGAVTVQPAGSTVVPEAVPVREEEIADEIERLKSGRGSLRSRASRLSLAGVQEKFALALQRDGTWAFPQNGYPSTHIVKPEMGRFPGLAMNEHTCMELARRAGLEAAETQVRTFAGHKALIVERFDRGRNGERMHQEDFAQALGTRGKYQKDGNGTGPSLKDLFTKGPYGGWQLWDQVMFAWIIGNEDAHAKNFSVLYPRDGTRKLAPIYDAVCTMAYPELTREMAWKIGSTYHANAVNEKDLGGQAALCGLDGKEAVQRLHELAEKVRTASEEMKIDGWNLEVLERAGVSRRLDRAI